MMLSAERREQRHKFAAVAFASAVYATLSPGLRDAMMRYAEALADSFRRYRRIFSFIIDD